MNNSEAFAALHDANRGEPVASNPAGRDTAKAAVSALARTWEAALSNGGRFEDFVGDLDGMVAHINRVKAKLLKDFPELAERLSPVSPTVLVEVSGGVATVEMTDSPVSVILVDYDREGETMSQEAIEAVVAPCPYKGTRSLLEQAVNNAAYALDQSFGESRTSKGP